MSRISEKNAKFATSRHEKIGLVRESMFSNMCDAVMALVTGVTGVLSPIIATIFLKKLGHTLK